MSLDINHLSKSGINAYINHTIAVKAINDSGSSKCLMSMDMAKDARVVISSLPRPIHCTLAMDTTIKKCLSHTPVPLTWKYELSQARFLSGRSKSSLALIQ
jgi:hypothetical protein